jgi:hypothetical protein
MRALRRLRRRSAGSEQGFAVLSVLFVLLALLVLCAPFLMTARNASRASTSLSERAQGRIALDSAAMHARGSLRGSHPSVDATPYSDSEEELRVDNLFDPAFLDASDPRGIMWDLEARDVAGMIDVNSASPQLFANLFGVATRLNEPAKAGGKELIVASTQGFQPQGFLWVDRELIGYTSIEGNVFKGLVRGLAGAKDADDKPLDCGPSVASDHAIGAPVLDQRAYAPVLWRIGEPLRGLLTYDAVEKVRDASRFAMAGSLGPAALEALSRWCSVYGGLCAGREWQRPVRLMNGIKGGRDCALQLDEARWFNPGTTVRVSDGQSTEYGIVSRVDGTGVRLMMPLANDYLPFSAEVRALARRPVNINVAPAEVLELLFWNLQVAGHNVRITREEAKALAQLVVASRPFTGHEDFLRRVVLPAAGVEKLPSDAEVVPDVFAGKDAGTLIDVWDGVALYLNGLNANDGGLAFSTLPYCFTSRDVYDLDLRASINAHSGAERVSLQRDQVELIAPQQDLLRLWARQEDFDESFRLDLEAPWWATGPNATTRWDGGASPPSRLAAHWGTYEGQMYVPGSTQLPVGAPKDVTGQHVFASRDDTAWAQLWASRTDEVGQRQGRVLHFDNETRDLEGRYLPDETIAVPTSDKLVGWTSTAGGLARSFNASLWFKSRDLGEGLLLDVGATSIESDRVTLGLEGDDLVLRVMDGSGDHPGTQLKEFGEVRYAITPQTATANGTPGILRDTWMHVQVDVRGTRPDQMCMLVDGRDLGVRTPGASRLTSNFGPGNLVMTIEDDEGFPDQGLVRIGDELVEYTKMGKNALRALRESTGLSAGFGGRLAREPYSLAASAGVEPGQNAASGKNITHSTGTPVVLCGYSLPLTSNVPPGSSVLTQGIGKFAVAKVAQQNGILMGGAPTNGVPVGITGIAGGIQFGNGIDGNTQVSGLVLETADGGNAASTFMEAFDRNGGYALLFQSDSIAVPAGYTLISTTGAPMLGMEIIKYSGWTGTNTLLIQQRAALPVGTGQQVPRAFVSQWQLTFLNGTVPANELEWQLFVVPISLRAASQMSFLQPSNGSEFAQITEIGNAEYTEWVRYDQIIGTDLIRSDPSALGELFGAVTHRASGQLNPPGPPPPDSGPPPAPAPAGPAQQPWSAPPEEWLPYIGLPEDGNDMPVTQAARTAFQFRGVLGTYSHKHGAGAVVLPVWRVMRGDTNLGRPGRLDFAFLFDAPVTDPGWPVRVHRAYQPFQHTYIPWTRNASTPMLPGVGQAVNPPVIENGFNVFHTYVALQEPLPTLIAAGTLNPTSTPEMETRMIARLTLHPSGERPREVDRAVIGGSLRGGQVPSAVVDEIVFGSTNFAENTVQKEALQGASLVMVEALPQGAQSFHVLPQTVRGARGLYTDAGHNFLSDLPKDAGLLRIGSEIVAYDALDPSGGGIALAVNGRGLLGTREETHEIGEPVGFLQHHTMSLLSGGANGGSSLLSLESSEEFPFSGTVLVGQELIHYTRLLPNALEMPRASSKPGAMDRKGDGIFRGRYGTAPASHGAGEPVILFPFRYWDRWADRADGPELSYFSFVLDHPNAYFQSVFWSVESTGIPGTQISVLERTDPKVPWDSEVDKTKGLRLLQEGMPKGEGNPMNAQRDRAEWRVFVRYGPSAFDAITGMSHAWKQTPRLKLFGVQYLGPDLVVRRVDQ